MAVTALLTTYEDGTRLDSWTTGIVNIDPVDTPFTTTKGVVKMEGTQHEVFYDQLYLVSTTHTVLEGADTAAYWNEAPSVARYKIENLRHAYKVTRHEFDARKKHGENPFKRERMKAGKVIKNVLEERAILSTTASGTTDTAPHMTGIVEILASYTYSFASVGFAVSALEACLTTSWANNVQVDEVYLPVSLKKKAATFVGSETVVNADAADKRIINKKDFYESDTTGLLKLLKSRVLTNFASAQGASAASRQIFFGVQSDLIKIGNFGGTTVDEMGPDADHDTHRGKMQMSACVIANHPKCGFVGVNYL
jgi:hypothetical protein